MTGPHWGIYQQSGADPTPLETAIGAPFTLITRETHLDAAHSFPNGLEKARIGKALIVVAINPYSGSGASKGPIPGGNATVAAGGYDDLVHAWISTLSAYKASGGQAAALYHIEPAASTGFTCGTPADYKAAWAHILPMFRAAGIQLGCDFTAGDWKDGTAASWEPADYDILSTDGYSKKPTKTAHDTFDAFFAFAKTRTKPTLIRSVAAEFDDATQAKFATDVSAMCITNDVLGVAWDLSGFGIDPKPTSVPLTLAAFKAAAQTFGDVQPPVQVPVPNVVGMTVEAAIQALDAVGLVAAGDTAGTVWTQTPTASTLVDEGSTVTLTVTTVDPCADVKAELDASEAHVASLITDLAATQAALGTAQAERQKAVDDLAAYQATVKATLTSVLTELGALLT